jgi:hypothetical protein
MLIRYGCKLSVVVERPTPVFCLVDMHPDRRKDVIREIPFQASPALPLNTMHDAFGNVMQRAVWRYRLMTRSARRRSLLPTRQQPHCLVLGRSGR